MQSRCTELVEVYLGPLKNAMLQAQGHIANWTFVPKGTLQSVESASEKVRWGYRFGFNGKENDNEVFGAVGTFQDYGMRGYDTRVGRFIKVDPIAKQYPMLTPYQFASNNPIQNIDLDGLEGYQFMQDLESKWNYTKLQAKTAWDNAMDAVETALTYTDVNDATVLVTTLTRGGDAVNWDGTSADGVDKGVAAAGAVLPLVSGSAVKRAVGPVIDAVRPSAKWMAEAARFGRPTADALKGARNGMLRKSLGLTNPLMDAHHVIPQQLARENSVVQSAIEGGFDFNGVANGIGVNKYHGSHDAYTKQLSSKLDDWAADNKGYSSADARAFVEGLAGKAKNAVNEQVVNGSKRVNEVVIE